MGSKYVEPKQYFFYKELENGNSQREAKEHQVGRLETPVPVVLTVTAYVVKTDKCGWLMRLCFPSMGNVKWYSPDCLTFLKRQTRN